MLKTGDHVDSLILINDGCVHLYGYHEFDKESDFIKMVRIKAVTLIKGSWIGDYEILYQVGSAMDLEAGCFDKLQSKLPAKMMQVYELPADDFYKLCDQFPTYRSFMI